MLYFNHQSGHAEPNNANSSYENQHSRGEMLCYDMYAAPLKMHRIPKELK